MIRGLWVLGLLALFEACIMMRPAGESAGSRPAEGTLTLREAAARSSRYVGAALSTEYFGEANYTLIAGREFNSLTPENQMKWEAIEPRRNTFAFEAADTLVAFAQKNGMRVRGHTLVWHSQLAPWTKGLSGVSLRAAMIAHVKAVVSHFKGRIAEWDVVNEAIADGPAGGLRDASPFTSLGPTFIDDAFRAAREADPDAVLFYNDYEIERPGDPKTEAVLRLVSRLKDAGVPIGGVGFQMHVDPRHWPPADAIRSNFERFAALGLAIEITEMDVPVGAMAGSLDEKFARQKAIAHDIVAACVAVARCGGITVWGFTDAHTWLNDPHWGALRGPLPHYPLPFDDDERAKPMFYGILDALIAAPAPSTHVL